MHNATPPSMAQHLVNAFAAAKSTEELILIVAGTDHMLNFCQELLELYDRDSRSPQVQEVNGLCRAHALLPRGLYSELRKILLALNRFHDARRDHFAVLGLTPAATKEEVRLAYRALSKQFHPDRLRDSDDSSQRFMEIASAYHAIMAARAQHQAEDHAPWRGLRLPRPDRRPLGQKIFFLVITGMICMLAGTSIYLAGRYNKQMIISQLRMDGPSPKKIEAQKITDDASNTLQALATEQQPAAGKKGADTEERPRAENGSPLPAGGPAADNPGIQLHPSAPPMPRKPLAHEQSRLPETLTFHRPKQTETPGGLDKPGATRKDMEKEFSLPAQDDKQPEPKQRIFPEPGKEAGSNTAVNLQPPPAKAAFGPEEIISLLNQYSSLYCRRELSSFLTLFAEDATENGTPLPRLTGQYRSLFAHTRTIDLHLADMKWSEQQKGFRARGNFRSSYTYDDGRTREHTGEISFFLINEHGKLKIKALDYVFLK